MIENRHYCVLSDTLSNNSICQSTAIILHLYYEEKVNTSLQYIKKMPKEVDVYVISPKDEILTSVQEIYSDSNITIIKKQNRGRDISALLISCRDFVFKYKYVCFLHDKKAIRDELTDDTDLWVRNLWDNMIASANYVRNVYSYFVNHADCGLLIPPERHGDYFNDWIQNKWGKNYKSTKALADRLGLRIDVDKEHPSASLGTVFWARTEVLKKLIDYPWKYEDFQKEPMDDDGTISHAIERIFPYLALDAGYYVKTVVSERYCPILLEYAQKASNIFVAETKNLIGVSRVSELFRLNYIKKILIDSKNNDRKIYLYGAGVEGKYCLRYVRSLDIEPDGFLESYAVKNEFIEGVKVYRVTENIISRNDLIVITPFDKTAKNEIERIIVKFGINDFLYWKE